MSPKKQVLELSSSDLRKMVERAMEPLAAHLDSLPGQPAADTDRSDELARSLKEENAPEQGTDFAQLLDILFGQALTQSLNTASPGYLAYIPGGGLLHSAVADLISNVVNRYVGVWIAAAGLVQLESNVIRWFSDLLGFPAQAGGYLSSGGSMANFSALVAARHDRLPENFLKGTLYCSDQIHHSVRKAALLAGFPASAVRTVPSDAGDFRIRCDRLEEMIEGDRERGLKPFLVAASAGTVNSGAVDALQALAQIAQRHRLWYHVDAAYGGFFLLTEQGRRLMKGIEKADSVTLDPHKGLFLPYGTGCLLVRDQETLRRSHSVSGDYMPPMQEGSDRVDFCEISPELSRDFRGLRVWLPLKMIGLKAFREALEEKLQLASWIYTALAQVEHLTLPTPPQLTVVPFRLEPPHLDGPALDELNRRFLELINASKRTHINATLLSGRLTPRLCILSCRTHRPHAEAALEDIKQAARRALSDPG